jgi:hypothetical protein
VKKIFLAPAVALAVLTMGTASAAPAISPSDVARSELTVAAASRALVYRCWTYDTQGGNWSGTHQVLWRARSNAMAACRSNHAYAAVCYHYTGPCEELYL